MSFRGRTGFNILIQVFRPQIGLSGGRRSCGVGRDQARQEPRPPGRLLAIKLGRRPCPAGRLLVTDRAIMLKAVGWKPNLRRSGAVRLEIRTWLLSCAVLATVLLSILFISSQSFRRDRTDSTIVNDQRSPQRTVDSLVQNDWANRLSNASAGIAQKILPAVVSIQVVREGIVAEDEELSSFFGQLPVPKNVDKGSGFFIRPDGWVITNYHVVRQANKIEVVQSNGESSSANVTAFDSASDIAMLRIEATNRPWLDWASQPPITGHLVWVAGAPYGLEGSLSMGIISAVNRTSLSGSPMRDYLQTDAVVNPGHSGGPVVDADGKVVGIASVILGDEYRGIGFALPSATAKSVSDQLIESGTAVRGWIGAKFGQVTLERARKTGIEDLQGAYVERISSANGKPSPAEQAGLRVGDICTSINDTVVRSQFDLARSIATLKPGDIARLKIIRNGQSLTVEVTIAKT